MPHTLTARELRTHSETILNPVVHIDGGLITHIESEPHRKADEKTILTSTFFDIHTHGAAGFDVMHASPSELRSIQRFLATRGVGHYLPTTVTAPLDQTLRALDSLSSSIESPLGQDGALPVGIHLEGPFLSHAKRGVHTAAELLAPDVGLFDRFQRAARGHIQLVTLAPELPGATELIEHCTSLGIRVSLGHTNARTTEALAAVQAGATSATHTFNAMRKLDHRDPGVLGTVLDDGRLYAEIICDGIHVAPELVRLFIKAKGLDRAILVTDSISATGMGDGTYQLGDLQVTVAGERCLLAGTDTLAGSVLTLPTALLNLSSFTGLPWIDAVPLASRNPADMLGLSATVGSLAPGQPANFNRFDASGNLLATYLRGSPVS